MVLENVGGGGGGVKMLFGKILLGPVEALLTRSSVRKAMTHSHSHSGGRSTLTHRRHRDQSSRASWTPFHRSQWRDRSSEALPWKAKSWQTGECGVLLWRRRWSRRRPFRPRRLFGPQLCLEWVGSDPTCYWCVECTSIYSGVGTLNFLTHIYVNRQNIRRNKL